MGLKRLPPRIPLLRPRLASLRVDGLNSPATAAKWRKWYGLRAWRLLRRDVLLAAAFTCRRCGRVEGDSGQLVADHIVPHRGDVGRFFDRANLQCLCKPCHDGVKQREEQVARMQGRG